MELNISQHTFISTTPSRKRKKKYLSNKRILDLLSPVKHSRVLKNIPSPTKRKRKKRKPQTPGSSKTLPNPHFNCTIDLSAEDSIVEPLQCDSPIENADCEEVCVVPSDLVQEKVTQKEIIDLTTNFQPLGSENQEPTVIDLSDSDDKPVPDNEVFVIGTYSKNSLPTIRKRKRSELDYIPLSSISACSTSMINNNSIKSTKSTKSKKCRKKNKFQIEYNNLVKSLAHNSNFADIDNVYTNSPVTLPSSGLRPIIIDGSNVAFVHSSTHFSCKRLEICIKYFKEKGHKVTAFVPQFRLQNNKNDNPNLLRKLEKQGDVVLTPSKTIDGRSVVPYDDRFIVQTAVLKGGIIVSRDNYNDLLQENPAWADTIKYRVLAFTWVDDVLMFPKDPLGLRGPSLEEFLRF